MTHTDVPRFTKEVYFWWDTSVRPVHVRNQWGRTACSDLVRSGPKRSTVSVRTVGQEVRPTRGRPCTRPAKETWGGRRPSGSRQDREVTGLPLPTLRGVRPPPGPVYQRPTLRSTGKRRTSEEGWRGWGCDSVLYGRRRRRSESFLHPQDPAGRVGDGEGHWTRQRPRTPTKHIPHTQRGDGTLRTGDLRHVQLVLSTPDSLHGPTVRETGTN